MISLHCLVLPLVALLVVIHNVNAKPKSTENHRESPLYQHLPDCSAKEEYTVIQKETKAKGIICPMFKDEEGFLSEFVAYYQMHGIDHIRFYDHDSTDHSLDELQPWIKSGFVSVESNFSHLLDDMPYKEKLKRSGMFNYMMHAKAHVEQHCKKWAQDNGFDFFFSVDIDEYLMPIEAGVTIMDTIYKNSENNQKSIYHLEKLNFQQAPHNVEPIELLTIEAYQVRNDPPTRMTYYKNVKNKVALRLNHHTFTDVHRHFVVYCCDFHGCQFSGGCSGQDVNYLFKGNKNGGGHGLQIMHYSRSLEKFSLKSKTWVTATGENGAKSSNYHLGHFLERQIGTFFDNRAALRYGCQVRNVLRQQTKEEKYLRPGDFWYRNVVHGKPMTDGSKGKRYGHPIQEGFKAGENHKNLYMGKYRDS